MEEYRNINDQIEMNDGSVVDLYERHNPKEVEYYTIDEKGNRRDYKVLKHPQDLSDEERYRVLDYCLGVNNYHKDEIVNFNDLFIQAEFIKEV